LHGIGFGDGAFDTWDVNATLFLVEVITLQQGHFGGPQAVMIGELKQRPISFAVDDAEQPTHLILGEEGDLRKRCGVLAGFHRPTV
jgi:hypothetical protein